MKEALRAKVEEALRALLAAAGDPGGLPDFAIEVPRQKDHGDFSCNAAMLLAKRLDRKPREIAQRPQSPPLEDVQPFGERLRQRRRNRQRL